MTYSSPLLDTVFQRCSKNAMGIPSDDLNIQRHLVCRLGTSCFAQQCHGSRLRHCSSYLAPGTVRPPATLRSTWFHLVQQLPIPGSRASTIECSLTWGQDDQDISRYIKIYLDISRYLKISQDVKTRLVWTRSRQDMTGTHCAYVANQRSTWV